MHTKYAPHRTACLCCCVRALAAATNLPVIGVVPRTWLDRHRRVFRHEIYRYAGGVAGLVLFAIVVIAQQSRLTGLIRGLAS